MTAETHKRNHHHHHAHHHQHANNKAIVHLKSIERVTSLPVVGSVHAYYEKIKKTNPLIKWSLMPAETGVWLAVGTAMPVVAYFEKPVSAVDSIFCKGLDVIEANLPVVTYPPELMFNITKDYVNSKVVTPMLKRADSVKQIGISGANICGELAADRLNNAIDVADKYVDKYLPDIVDGTDSPAALPDSRNVVFHIKCAVNMLFELGANQWTDFVQLYKSSRDPPAVIANPNSKTAKTIQHVNQFGRKLQRRLTRRTIAEAQALKQQGADTIRCLVYLVDLLARDPKAFMEKVKEVWIELSKDEPENQVPPGNLEQLIAMLTREMARRVVHLTNYTGAKAVVMTNYTIEVVHISALNAVWWADYFIKTMHLESAMDMAATQITKFHHHSLEILGKLIELIRNLKLESLQSIESRALERLPPPQAQPKPSQQPQSSPVHTPTSATFSTSPESSPTLTNKSTLSQQNGDTNTVYESNHEAIAS